MNLPMAELSGTGFLEKTYDLPLFLNLYPVNVSIDPKTMELIMKQKGFYNSDDQFMKLNNNFSPIIIIPGLGLSPIYAKWDFTSTNNVKELDPMQNFETKTKWACKSYQDNWTKLWLPELDKLSSFCWSDNISVKYNNGEISNKDGLVSTVLQFDDFTTEGTYLDKLIALLESKGYIKGKNLFIASYDFRLIGDEVYLNNYIERLKVLIESLLLKTLNKSIIIGHDLGSIIASIFLYRQQNIWKNEYINKFISIGGSIGGTTKALRVLLSGEPQVKMSNFNKTIKNFTGIHLLLPSPVIFNDPILLYNQIYYKATDIPKLLKNEYGEDTSKLYNDMQKLQLESLSDPNVPVYLLSGTNMPSESFYTYKNLSDNPVQTKPYYNINNANFQQYSYNNLPVQNIGDGSILNINNVFLINTWKNIKYKFYDYEHLQILQMYEPLNDLLNIIQNN